MTAQELIWFVECKSCGIVLGIGIDGWLLGLTRLHRERVWVVAGTKQKAMTEYDGCGGGAPLGSFLLHPQPATRKILQHFSFSHARTLH